MSKIFQNKFLMIGLFLIFSFVSEILMFFFIKEGIVPRYILLNISSLMILGAVIFFIPSNRGSLIYLSIILGIQTLTNIVNCVMYDNCGDVFSFLYFKLLGEAARVFEFSFFNVGKILLFVGLVVGFVLLNVFLFKKNIIKKIESEDTYLNYLKKYVLGFVIIIVIFTATYAGQVMYIHAQDENDVFSDSYLYSSLNLKVEGLKSFGTWGYYAKEVKNLLFTSSVPDQKTIDEVNVYLSEGKINKTEYFGLLEDKNVIMIMMESVQWFAIDEVLTPNLYNLAKEGVTFSNYYSKNKTNISEMIGITGSYPVTNTLDLSNSSYRFTNSILNYLGDEYVSTYVHPNTGDFYKRKKLMPQLGFDKTYFFEDLYKGEDLYKWGDFSLDSVSMEKAVDYLVPSDVEKFYSFFTTLSTHGPYDDSAKNTKLLTQKGYFEKIDAAIEAGEWVNPLKDTDVGNSLRYYKAMAMDLDAAVGCLLDKLEEKGILDDTVIVLYGDHNAYYDDLSYLIYDSEGGEYYKPYIFKTPLIISNSELTSKYKELNGLEDEDSAHVEKFVSTYNIIPTLLDLLGYEYNSNLYLGTSAFEENDYDMNNVFFSLQGGIFNDVLYTINGYDLVYTELEEYEEELSTFRKSSALFLKKLKYIEYMYNYNLFDDLSFDVKSE